MVRRRPHARAWLTMLPFAVGCGAAIHQNTPTASPIVPALTLAALPVAELRTPSRSPDPVDEFIRASDDHFKAGEAALAQGHVESARKEFDSALAVLMESPFGGRTEPRIREHFDRLVDRISAYEIRALADGDGFTEKQYEPATIDELLAMSATAAPLPATPLTLESLRLDTAVHDVPIPRNARVLAFIELFQGRLREFIEDGMRRGSQYLPMIQGVFRAEGLPLDLAYIPLVESAFKPNAMSRAKAKGVWQFMKTTGRENGLRQDWYIDERSDPIKATVAAAKYLRSLAKMFDGDWHLALASYNGGPGRVQRAMRRGRQDDFWKLAGSPRLLPRETRDYVPMILAAIEIARNPALYGFTFEPSEPPASEIVTLAGPVDLRRVAEWIDVPVATLQTLNPELRRWTTPGRDERYDLRVPLGAADAVHTRLAAVEPGERASFKWYTVKGRETLAAVARRLQVSRSDLAEANYLKVNAALRPGQRLLVPHEATVLMAARTDRRVPVADSRPLASDPLLSAVDAPSGERVKVVYRIKRGDTLSSIAKVFSTNIASLRTWNRLASSRLVAGERLTIYTLRTN